MKTKITIFKLLLSLLAVALFFSCDNTITLGKKLDIEGPIVTITSPAQRQSVPVQFEIEGTTWDYTGVETLLIKAVTNNKDFQRQWRYHKKAWQISDDYGKTWSLFEGAEWKLNKESSTWKVPIDMVIAGMPTEEGEYTFNIQAWDKGGFTDDNSFKALVLIVDLDPPKVTLTNPILYSKYAPNVPPPPALDSEEGKEFKRFDAMLDNSGEWKAPEFLGKFITQEFSLKWQIEDSNDVWSIDLRFYPKDTVIDDDPDTPLPENYYYRYFENTPPPPRPADPNDFVKLNGSVTVQDLYGPAGILEGGGELKTSIPLKTTVKVVAVCYDGAGNPNQEKTLGYFISWPKANDPWIVFADGLTGPGEFYGKQVALDEKNPSNPYIEPDVFTVYPSRSVKATAFQSYGVKEVKYTLYEANTNNNTLNNVPLTSLKYAVIEGVPQVDIVVPNTSGRGSFSTIFPWEINVPPFTGYYIFVAEAFSSHDKPSEKYTMLFRVNDITFPDFVEGPLPSASDPLFMHIENNKIKIHGKVSDATAVKSLCMVWINPDSEGFAAMSQLSYFRNKDYNGWKQILTSASSPVFEGTYDSKNPNKLWKINLENAGMDYDTNRHVFSFEQEIDITGDMGIGPASSLKSLKSQVFLFRAENPDGKCTIITYAPQGDTLAPDIGITDVVIKYGANTSIFEPNTYKVVPQLKNNDTITINGTWWEDSAAYLDIQTYFLNNIDIDVNNQRLPKLTPANITVSGDRQRGTWTATITVGAGSGLTEDKLKDTLVIGVKAKDIGGNEAEIGCSWLIQSDNLRLMRISSEKEDAIYKTGDIIDIFLEFSKPVKLTNSLSQKPQLILSSRTGNNARAVYKEGQDNFNSRQYFEYTVTAGDATGGAGGKYLNVTGLYYNGNALTTGTPHNTADYPFTWSRGGNDAGDYEEVRITMQTGFTTGLDTGKVAGKDDDYYIRTLPVTTSTTNSDYQFTLPAGKHIEIDTTLPTVSTVAAASTTGHYQNGDIYITVTFSENVALGAVTPSLALAITNGAVTSYNTDPANIKVSGDKITFMYSIKAGDTTYENPVSITGFSGNIVDIAGNALSGTITGTLTGIYIDTIPFTSAQAPVVRVLSATPINAGNTIGTSGASPNNLTNLYNTNLWLAVTRNDGSTQNHRLARLEYSINGGTSWITLARASNNTPFDNHSMTKGPYTIRARQITESGIVSPVSQDITLNWDPGDFITRISTTSANGIYTNNTTNGGSRTDSIPITVTFRKKVKFSARPTITLNTTPTASNANIVTATYTANTEVTELTFNYAVGTTDNTPSGDYLDVIAFNRVGNATDEAGANINAYVSIPASLPTASTLKGSKSITIQTGPLSVLTAAAFNNNNLVIGFNRNILKGAGEISIIQSATDYRLPAVLTESQFSKYSKIDNVNSYYTRGSNGYNYTSNTDRGADTSTKYILRYNVDTAAVGTPSASGTAEQRLAEAFRQAEKITLSINAGAVTISGSQLTIALTDTNALQVPGAAYQVSYPQGFVQDSLSTPCPILTNQSVTLGGVAKPFIRINKRQDTITESPSPSNSQPRLVAAQPFLADVRMDCRTPGSTIYYFTTNAVTNNNNGTTANWTTAGGPQNTTAAPGQPNDPQTTTNNRLTYSAAFTIGTNNDYQGLQWYVRAKASKGSDWSVNSEEMAFKTVVTYRANGITAGDTGVTFDNGDQLWIRGGDAIKSSTVPGFPITWDIGEFDKAKADGKRAGIRLFTRTDTDTTALNNSTYKWITWDINTDAYFDIILGHDTASTAAEALQYGPIQFAYQRAGWTSFKEQCRILPGQHRWLVSNNPDPSKGALNFSGTFSARARYTGADITFTP
jgi:hypothetical protein